MLHSFCLGVDFDGTLRGVDVRPTDLTVDHSGASVSDAAGQVVLRAGDRIEFHGKLEPNPGDTSCAGDFLFSISDYALLPPLR